MKTNLYRLIEFENGKWAVETCLGGGNWETVPVKDFDTEQDARNFVNSIKVKRIVEI